MNEQIGVGVIGLGAISEAHIEAIQQNKNLKLVGVYNRTESKAKIVAENNKCMFFSDYTDLIKNKDIELVVMLTPPGSHEEMITACANYGKHVFAEKPIGTNIEAIKKYLKLCDEKSLKIAVVSQHRFNKSSLFANDKMQSGKLGKLSLSNCIVNWYRDDSYYDSWHNNRELSGGGVLAIQAIHTIDLMISFMGKVRSVKGYSKKIRGDYLGVEDLAGAILEFENGALGVISATTSAFPGKPATLELMGDKGTVTITGEEITYYESQLDDVKYESESQGDDKSFADPGKISIDSLSRQYADVIQSIKEDKEPIVSGRVAKETYEVIDAIYRSSDTNKEIIM